MTNKFFRLLCSLPIILVTLYFLPFLGVCLLLFRFYLYKGRTNFKTSFILLILLYVIFKYLLHRSIKTGGSSSPGKRLSSSFYIIYFSATHLSPQANSESPSPPALPSVHLFLW